MTATAESVEDGAVADQLGRRRSRPADFAAENRALTELARELAERPENLLQKLAEVIVETGIARSAGVSLNDEAPGGRRIRWAALTGGWTELRGGPLPLTDAILEAMARDAPLLIEPPERISPAAEAGGPRCEILLIPFRAHGRLAGALWAGAHGPDRRFDAEDLRLLTNLSRFAAAGACRMQAGRSQAVLLAELQHRVRNVLSLVRSLVRRTLTDTDDTEDVAAHLEGRLTALARTQSLLTRAAGAGLDLDLMIREELLAQAADESRLVIEGPEVTLAPKSAEVLSLAVHELATNSTKYGAIAQNGRLEVRWRRAPRPPGPDWLELTWRESGVRVISSGPRKEGFGTELITRRVPYELRGEGRFDLRPGELVCELAIPLIPGESILQTDGPGEGDLSTGEMR